MEFIQQFLIEEALILIPVLYVIGMFFKSVEVIKDKYIPILTWACSITICFCYFGINIEAFIQATLVAGATNFASQLYIQATKKDK